MLSPTHLRREGEDYEAQILSKAVKAGRRTYFFDVRATRGDDYFLTITESRKITAPDGTSSYDRHKIFLYKEDFRNSPTDCTRSSSSSAAARHAPSRRNSPFRSVSERAEIGHRPGSAVRCAGVRRQLPGGGGGLSA